MDKILQIDKNQNRYIRLADQRFSDGDLVGALSMLFSAEKIKPSHEIFMRIADIYSDMDLLELSNKYWYKFMLFAPENVVSTSYEELAINYFYLDNLWASGYYLHKKLSTDGFLSKDDIDKEVIDFFSGEEIKKNAYRIVYPLDKADFSFEIKCAKRALRAGAFKQAIMSLEKIPYECYNEEIMNDLSLAQIMTEDYEKAEKTARDSLNRFNESVGAYCNLSTIYDFKDDHDKGEYYYKKALSVRTGSQDEPYKIATCAIERADHVMAKECIEKILEDRPYEIPMLFFYGIALLNLGQYDLAKKQFANAYKLSPKDIVLEYYLKLSIDIKNGEISEKILPLKYVKELPKKEILSYSKKIKDLIKNPQKISMELKKEQVLKILCWGLAQEKESLKRESAMILSAMGIKGFKEIASELLIDPEIDIDAKRLMIYALILKGYKGKIGIAVGNFFCQFNQRKLACEKDKNGGLYLSSYALCLSRMIFYGIEELDKMAASADKIYKIMHLEISDAEVNNEELAGLILLECNYENFNEIDKVCKIFEVSPNKLKKLKNIIEQFS